MHKVIISTIICLLATTSFAAESVDTEVKETVTTISGLKYTSFIEGTGPAPRPTDTE